MNALACVIFTFPDDFLFIKKTVFLYAGTVMSRLGTEFAVFAAFAAFAVNNGPEVFQHPSHNLAGSGTRKLSLTRYEFHDLAAAFPESEPLVYDGKFSDHAGESQTMLVGKTIISPQKAMEKGIAHIKKAFSGDERFLMLSEYYAQNHYSPLSSLISRVAAGPKCAR